jgi:hypothetical protein
MQWEALVRQLKEVCMNEGRDKMTWELEKRGFTPQDRCIDGFYIER